jgi:hypothetical protein
MPKSRRGQPSSKVVTPNSLSMSIAGTGPVARSAILIASESAAPVCANRRVGLLSPNFTISVLMATEHGAMLAVGLRLNHGRIDVNGPLPAMPGRQSHLPNCAPLPT